MIEAHDTADRLTAVIVFGQPVARATLLSGANARRINRQHATLQIQAVDCFPVGFALHRANAEAAETAACLSIVAEPQAQHVQDGSRNSLLWRLGQHLLRRSNIGRDIAFTEGFFQQAGRQCAGIREGRPNSKRPQPHWMMRGCVVCGLPSLASCSCSRW